MFQFVCDVVKDTGKQEYLFSLDWIGLDIRQSVFKLTAE